MTAHKSLRAQAQLLAQRTQDAWSAQRYGTSWLACCAMLLRRGLTEHQAEAILRSKWTRWAADASAKRKPTSSDLSRWLDTNSTLTEINKLTKESFG